MTHFCRLSLNTGAWPKRDQLIALKRSWNKYVIL